METVKTALTLFVLGGFVGGIIVMALRIIVEIVK